MSYKRQEIESALPPAPQTMLKHISDKCKIAGVYLSEADLIFIGRATTDYLVGTGEGKQAMLKLLNADVVPASYTKTYYPDGFYGEESRKLDYRGLVEYRGWVYKGKSVPWRAIETRDGCDKEACSDCGGLVPKTYCAQQVKTIIGGKEHLETLCNHCRMHSTDPRTRDTANRKNCDECKLIGCQFHPKRSRTLSPSSSNMPPEPPHPADSPKQIEYKPMGTIPSWADPKFGAI